MYSLFRTNAKYLFSNIITAVVIVYTGTAATSGVATAGPPPPSSEPSAFTTISSILSFSTKLFQFLEFTKIKRQTNMEVVEIEDDDDPKLEKVKSAILGGIDAYFTAGPGFQAIDEE